VPKALSKPYTKNACQLQLLRRQSETKNVSVTLWENPSLAGEVQDTWQAAGNKENLLSIILAALPAVAAELI